jgi:hypothetical protein
MDILTLHRIHFAFTITFHYLFPQLTMGLALLIVILKTLGLKTGEERYDVSARFWGKIFAVNFLLGVVTGIPMEFQFGTNWSEFSRRTGGVIGMPLAMGFFSLAKRGYRAGDTGRRRSWCFWDHGYPDFSLLWPTHGCNIRSRINCCRMACLK